MSCRLLFCECLIQHLALPASIIHSSLQVWHHPQIYVAIFSAPPSVLQANVSTFRLFFAALSVLPIIHRVGYVLCLFQIFGINMESCEKKSGKTEKPRKIDTYLFVYVKIHTNQTWLSQSPPNLCIAPT